MSKRLQIDYVRVNKVQFGQKTSLEEGVLTVCNCSAHWISNWQCRGRAAVFWESMILCSRGVRQRHRRHPTLEFGENLHQWEKDVRLR